MVKAKMQKAEILIMDTLMASSHDRRRCQSQKIVEQLTESAKSEKEGAHTA